MGFRSPVVWLQLWVLLRHLYFARGKFCLYFMGHIHTTLNPVLLIVPTILGLPAYHPFITGITVNFHNCNMEFYSHFICINKICQIFFTLFRHIRKASSTHDPTIVVHAIFLLSTEQSIKHDYFSMQ